MSNRTTFPSTWKRRTWRPSPVGIVLGVGLLFAVIGRTPVAGLPYQQQTVDSGPGHPSKMQPQLNDDRVLPDILDAKQRKDVLHADLKKSKKDASELAALARELQVELNKPNATSLSLDSLNRIERIEKLAKKIRDEIKGF